MLILKGGWVNYNENIVANSTSFKGLFTGTVEFSPTIPVTKYAEICPFAGVGIEMGLMDTLSFFDNFTKTVIHSYNYSFGSYVYANIINNLQVYFQFAWVNQLNNVNYNESYFNNEYMNDKNWNDIFPNRYGFRTAIGIRIRLGGT